ncbi:phosphotransferase [Amycolatopsis acidicola]|uniref:Phosphotransferase n=1 Tax=Amycolatopsis acidicola TaxID=2596893 RepID=A0A5N0UYQ8_9PSEU|nr:phosphotransferase [Amycolatopsis acidicola]KAA9156777.1 phosphotransferase [Amycolatopsis acidicola]
MFPRSLREVTPDWLSGALAQRYPGTRVTSVVQDKVINGMATKVRLRLTYDDAGQAHKLPDTMWLKTGFESHSERSALLYASEVNFFAEIAPLANANLPATYYEAIDPATGNGVLLLEDLGQRGVRFGHPLEPVTPAVARSLLDILARLHALPTTTEQVGRLGWLKPGGAIHAVNVVDEYLDFWDTASQQPRFAFVPETLQDRARIRAALKDMEAQDRANPAWLVHGDPHQGNVFFDAEGNGGFLDWQTVALGHWAFDVAYFLIMSLTVEDRREHEQSLVRHYLERLAVHAGQAPGFEDAWLDYRRHAIWCFLTVLCPVERQPEEVCLANAERTCAALADLATLDGF